MFASLRDMDGVLWEGGLSWADMEEGELECRFGLRGIVRELVRGVWSWNGWMGVLGRSQGG